MIVEQGPTDESTLESWLDEFDDVLDLVQDAVVGDRPSSGGRPPKAGVRPYEIIQEERLDIERLNADKRLICACSIHYKLV